MTATELDDAVNDLLRPGSMTKTELLTGLIDAGIDLGADPEATLEALIEPDDLSGVVELTDGPFASLPAELKGRSFTRQVTEAEVKHDILQLCPDLGPLTTPLAATT